MPQGEGTGGVASNQPFTKPATGTSKGKQKRERRVAVLLHEAAYTKLVAPLVKLGIVLLKRGRVGEDGSVDQPSADD